MNGGYYADLIDLTDRIRAEHRREVAKLEQKLADAAAYENDLLNDYEAAIRLIARTMHVSEGAAEDLVFAEKRAGEV
jgi:hypothetical protein